MKLAKFPSSFDSNEARLNEAISSRNRLLELDLVIHDTSAIIRIKGGRNRYQTRRLAFWMKDKYWELEENNYQITLTSAGINGRLDGIALAANTNYLLWAIGNAGNTEVTGFGATRRPQANLTAIAGATEGGTATITSNGVATNGLYSFTVGARVIIRNSGGGAGVTPNFEWNQGIIQSITSNTSATVLMDTGLPGAATITGTTSLEVIQLDRFRPWNGATTGDQEDAVYSSTFRLIGETWTDAGTLPNATRRTTQQWGILRFAYPTVTRNAAGTTATSYHYYRYLAPWVSMVGVKTTLNSSSGTLRCTAALLHNVPGTGTEILDNVYDPQIGGGQTAQFFSNVPIHSGIATSNNTFLTGAGTVTTQFFLYAYQDGGLREY